MQIAAASSPGGSAPNEDFYLVSDRWALVLDGITRYPDDGCVHDVPWYVARLGAAVAARVGDDRVGLAAVLAEAIAAVNDLHADTCDLRNSVTPGATIAIVRRESERLAWLVLGDSAVAWRDREGRAEHRSDDRLANLTGAPPAESVAGVRRWPVRFVATVRNREGGFWVAAADPEAASRAFTGSIPRGEVSELLLCTDGLTRLIDRYGYSWSELFERAAVGGGVGAGIGVGAAGISGLIDLVREHGERDTRFHPEAKRHDDATGVLMRC
jgi:hypothetical protein